MKKYSIKKKIKRYIVLTMMLIMFVFELCSVIGIYFYINNVRRINANSLSLQAGQIEDILNDAKYFSMNIFANSSDFALLSQKDIDNNSMFSRLGKIHKLLKSRTVLASEKAGYFVYKDVKNGFYSSFSSYYSTEEAIKMNSCIKSYIKREGRTNRGQWEIVEEEGVYYLLMVFQRDDAYVGAIFNLNHDIGIENSDEIYTAYIYDDQWIANKDVTEKLGKNLEKLGSSGNLIDYIVVKRDLAETDIQVALIIYMENLRTFLLISTVLIVGISSLVFILLYWLYRTIHKMLLYPVEQLSMAERQIREGKQEILDSDSIESEEFGKINQAVISMVHEISNLKIENYEKKIQIQEANIQYYQLQSKPHFLLNCMKILYAMAENRNYEEIQHMIQAISDYFRHTFRNNSESIDLQEEMETTEKYFYLCQRASSIPMVLNIDIDETCRDFRVPILTIQGFVENSIKYAKVENRILMIKICAGIQEGLLHITISDNGSGYSKDVLKTLLDNNLSDMEGHIGIYNIMSRMQLLYPQAIFLFYNLEQGGAVTEIKIPLNV